MLHRGILTTIVLLGSLAAAASCGDDEPVFGTAAQGGQAGVGGAGGTGGAGAGVAQEPCGEPPEPTAEGCPPECNSGCLDGVCYIGCTGDQSCNQKVTCPPGIACQVGCGGLESCRFEIHCDDGYPCAVSCSGESSCKGADLYCGATSDCNVICSPASEACQGLKVHCGEGECGMQCFGSQLPQFDCGESCDCTVCRP